MDEKKLWKRFAELDINYKLEILQTALHCTEQRAKELYDTVTAELERRWKLDVLARTWNPEKEKLVLSRLKSTRKAPKKNKIMRYVDEIAALRQRNVGWNKIAEYLKRAHRLKVSGEFLRKTFREIL